MKFAISQKAFAKAITAASRISMKNTPIPILTHVMLHATGETVSIRATDLDMEITTVTTAAAVQQGGSVCVPASTLREIASKLPDDAEVKVELDDGKLKIKGGRSRFQISTLPAEDWPNIIGDTGTHSFEISGKNLARMIEKVSFAISTEETRYYLNGAYLHTAEVAGVKYLRMVATDGHRLGLIEIECPESAANIPGVIVPRKALTEVDRLLKDAPEKVCVRLSENFVLFDLGLTVIASKLIDGTFPDYSRVIPTGCDKTASLDAASLFGAVARVSTIASERGRAVKFAFGGDALKLSVTNPEMGEAVDEIEAEWNGPDGFEAGFNSAYVQDCITALDPGRITMRLDHPGAPCLITSDKDPSTLIVLMPMRV